MNNLSQLSSQPCSSFTRLLPGIALLGIALPTLLSCSAEAAPAASTPPATIAKPTPAHVNVASANGLISFTPSGGVAALRVQVRSLTGSLLYDSGWVSGSAPITWQALSETGTPLPSDVYPTRVEVRDASGTSTTESGSLQLDLASTTKDVTPRATTITGSGTANRIVLWTSDTTVGDSIITQTNSTTLSVAGTINATAVNATNPNGNALVGNSNSSTALAGITQTGYGVLGVSQKTAGVRGVSTSGIGVRGDSNQGTTGVQGNSNSAAANNSLPIGVDGTANGGATSIGVRGTSTSGIGVSGVSTSGAGVSGNTASTTAGAAGVVGTITSTNPSSDAAGVRGVNNSTTANGIGVLGIQNGKGYGVYGTSPTGFGVAGQSDNGTGVAGLAGSSTTGVGVFGQSIKGLAGKFDGNVQVTGNLAVSGTISKGGGTFEIDDPRDPANKILTHSFVESPDMMNIYNGTIVLDKAGRATVQLPPYFQALNRSFRYALTPIGAPAPNLYVAQEVSGNHFAIAGGKPGLKISWQVTGVRQDRWAIANRVIAERDKGTDRGTYVHPALYSGKPLKSRAFPVATSRQPSGAVAAKIIKVKAASQPHATQDAVKVVTSASLKSAVSVGQRRAVAAQVRGAAH